MSIDLHCHTKISDGSIGVEELLATAKRRGLSAISITDHDAVTGATRATMLGKRLGIDVVHGVEFSAYEHARNNAVHMLCYLCDSPDRLEGTCRKMALARRAAATEMLRKVMRYYPIVPEAVTRCAAGCATVYKQHIMHALIDAGYADSFYGETYRKLFSHEAGVARVNVEYPDVWEIVDLIHSAGGLAVLAHPASYRNEELMQELTEKGLLDGIEVWHPDHSAEDKNRLYSFAQDNSLLMTGGTDFHGMYAGTAKPLGNSEVPENTPQLMRTYKAHKCRR